jgi:hypothetical protein
LPSSEDGTRNRIPVSGLTKEGTLRGLKVSALEFCAMALPESSNSDVTRTYLIVVSQFSFEYHLRSSSHNRQHAISFGDPGRRFTFSAALRRLIEKPCRYAQTAVDSYDAKE